jgi:hypothetical protein
MTVLRRGRLSTGPAGTGEMLTRHAALAAAVQDAFPGLIDMQLAKAGDRRWAGASRWDPLASAQAALPARPSSRRPGPQSRPPKASRPDTRRPSMRERTPPVPRKDAADPCRGRHAPHQAWPAPPPPQPRHRIGRTTAARRGGEQA